MQTDSVTLDVAGAKVTIPAATLTKLWLAELSQPTNAAQIKKWPRIGNRWLFSDDVFGTYAGIARGRGDGGDYHLIVADREQANIKWQGAIDWARNLGDVAGNWRLPTRAEQALLFANVPELFEKEYYWSCEQSAGAAQYAWSQSFGSGYQYGYRKDTGLRARAVRRVTIE